MRIVLADIWQAWRTLLRRPGYLLLATGVLALGIGAAVAVAVLIQAVLLRPLPYPQPSRLVALGEERLGVAYRTSPQDYQHMLPLDGVQSIGLVGRYAVPKNVAGDGEPELVPALLADRGLLPTLGVRPLLGRNFDADEDRPGGAKVVILGYGFWMRRYGGDPAVLGRPMSIEGVPTTIVGVLPSQVDVGQGDLLLPLALAPGSTDDGGNYRAIARLAPAASAAAVGSQLQVRLHALHGQWGGPFAAWWATRHFRADPLQAVLRVDARPVLMLFLASALGLLLIALINLANLMFSRILTQGGDVAIRHALGAPGLRVALPAVAEGLLIGLAGSVSGSVLAGLGLLAMRGWIPAPWLGGADLGPAPAMIPMALGIGMAVMLMASLLGLWQASRSPLADELRGGGRTGASRRDGLLGRALVVVQVALATLLLCASGAFLQALYHAARTPLGFQSDGVLTFELSPVAARYPDAASVHGLTTRLLARLQAVPGVGRVSVGTGLPMGDESQNFYLGNIHAQGQPPLEAEAPQFRAVDAGFFQAFDIAPRQGRVFGDGDGEGGEQVAVINEQLDRRMFGGHGLGQLVEYTAPLPGGGGMPRSARIVGVIGSISPFGPLGDRDGMLYVPWAQMPDPLLEVYRGGNPLHFALRVHGTPDAYRAAVGAAVAEVAPGQPVAHLAGMPSIVHDTTGPMRLNLLLVGVFSVLALLLAASGVYAVMAVAVAARGREFAVRLALGASPARLAGAVLGSGLMQIAAGLLMGVVLSAALAAVLRASVAQLRQGAADPAVWLAVCAVLATAGAAACAMPALRAGRTAPMRALKGE